MFRFIYICVFFGLSLNVFSQGCFGYEKLSCKPEPSKYPFKRNEKSGAFLFNSGELLRIPIDLIQNKDYRITICGDSVFKGIILFVIKDTKGAEIYNNSNHSFSQNFEFSAKKNQDVFFEITVPDVSNDSNKKLLMEGCVGILIEEMNSIKTGF
jgi:hypothetical protein